jgi:hypothetical protein
MGLKSKQLNREEDIYKSLVSHHKELLIYSKELGYDRFNQDSPPSLNEELEEWYNYYNILAVCRKSETLRTKTILV